MSNQIEEFIEKLPREALEAGEDVLCLRDESYGGVTYRTSVNLYLVRQIVQAVLQAGGTIPRMHERPDAFESSLSQ